MTTNQQEQNNGISGQNNTPNSSNSGPSPFGTCVWICDGCRQQLTSATCYTTGRADMLCAGCYAAKTSASIGKTVSFSNQLGQIGQQLGQSTGQHSLWAYAQQAQSALNAQANMLGLLRQAPASQQLLNAMQSAGTTISLPKPKPLPVSEIIVGEIIAYRGWYVDGGYLKSFSQEAIWPPGEPMTGKVASDEHGAGVYAFKTKRLMFDFLKGMESLVWGSVALWGDVVEHELGYRAENAKILTLEGMFPACVKVDLTALRQRYGLAE